MSRLNVGCAQFYADGWVNVDVVRNDHVRPDVVVGTDPSSWPFAPASFDRVYVGHVLEHLPIDAVVPFLVGLRHLARPGSEAVVVGPDCHETLHQWRSGAITYADLWAVLEGPGSFAAHLGLDGAERWEGDRHQWNSTRDRTAGMLVAAGWHWPVPVLIDAHTTEVLHTEGWPVVSGVAGQFGLHTRA